TISEVNDNPTAANDTKSVNEDGGSVDVDVLANDSIAPDTGETLSVTTTSAATKGVVAIVAGGSANGANHITYTPNANTNGADSFTYTISDGRGGTASATVNV